MLPSSAWASTGGDALDVSRVGWIAEQLGDESVFVSDHFDDSGDMPSGLRKVVDAARFDVYVAVVPAVPGALDGHDLAVAIHDWMGRDGVYVVVDGTGGDIAAASFGVNIPAADAARAVTADVPVEAGLVFRVETLVEVLESGDSSVGWLRAWSGMLSVIAGIGTFALIVAGRMAWASRGRRRRRRW